MFYVFLKFLRVSCYDFSPAPLALHVIFWEFSFFLLVKKFLWIFNFVAVWLFCLFSNFFAGSTLEGKAVFYSFRIRATLFLPIFQVSFISHTGKLHTWVLLLLSNLLLNFHDLFLHHSNTKCMYPLLIESCHISFMSRHESEKFRIFKKASITSILKIGKFKLSVECGNLWPIYATH